MAPPSTGSPDDPTTITIASSGVPPRPPGNSVHGGPLSDIAVNPITCPVISPRAFVALHVRGRQNNRSISALYDTGAQASVLCLRDYHALMAAGVPLLDIPTTQFRLQAANGSPMPIERVISVPVIIGHITASISFIVTSGSACSILGMNAISTFALTVDKGALVSTLRSSQDARPPPTNAVARLLKPISLGRREGKIATMAMFRTDGTRIREACDAVLDTGVAAVLIRTDRDGTFKGPCSNFSQASLAIPTSVNVGSIAPITDFSFLGRAEACSMAMSQPLAPHTPEQVAQIEKMLSTNIHRNTPRHHRERVLRLLLQYQDCFSCSKDDIGRCDLLQHEIDLDTNKPIFIPQFRLSTQHFAAIKDQLAAWIRAGIVQRSRSPYNNPVFCVPKPHNRGFRVVSDFRTLNSHTLEDKYSIPSVDEVLQRVGAARPSVFSSIDLSSGFYHVPLRPSDEKYTAFTLPGMGQFVWKRAAMGLTGSPSSFCRVLDLILHDVDHCLNYVDDILCFTDNFELHLQTLRNVLERLRHAGLRANPDKSVFATYEVDYLGHNLSRQGIRPTMEKLEAISEMAEPQSPKQLDKVLGFFNYLSNFVFHYAAKCGPLYALRRKDSTWKGGPLPPRAAAAFRQLRHELSSRPIVAFATADGPLHLYVDCALGGASDLGEGMGAALLQESPVDGLQRPISYQSRQLAEHERNYPVGLGEFKAIAWALDKLAPYLLHRKFFLYCDNRPLVDLNTFLKSSHKRTLKHCQHFLENFHPVWRHIPGSRNVLADFLSRYHGFQVHTARQSNSASRKREAAANVAALTHIAATNTVVDNSMPRIKLLQSMDPLCSRILKKIDEPCRGSTMQCPIFHKHVDCRWPLTVINGIVMAKISPRQGHMTQIRAPPSNTDHPSNGLHFLTPVSMRPEILNAAHECSGHFGSYKNVHAILDDHWWPGIDKDTAKHAAACAACLRASDKGQLQPAPLQPIPAATRPNELISTDLFGPVIDGRDDGRYVMTIVDAMTNHATIRVIPNKSAVSVANALLDYIYARGVPTRILTDCGKEFNNELQDHLWTALQVQKTWTSPYYPSVNGRAEKMNDVLAGYLRKARALSLAEKTDFASYLGPLALHYNTSVCSTTRISPHNALYGYSAKLPLWQKFEDIFPTVPGDRNAQDFIAENLQRQLAARRIAYSNRQQQQETMERRRGTYMDVEFPMYQPREAVLLRNMRRNIQPNVKFNEKWEPGYVISRVGPTTFKVCRADKLTKRSVTHWPAANIKPDPTRPKLDRDKWKQLGGSTADWATWDSYGYSQRETGRVADQPPPQSAPPPPPGGGTNTAPPAPLTDEEHDRIDAYNDEHMPSQSPPRAPTPDRAVATSPPPDLAGNIPPTPPSYRGSPMLHDPDIDDPDGDTSSGHAGSDFDIHNGRPHGLDRGRPAGSESDSEADHLAPDAHLHSPAGTVLDSSITPMAPPIQRLRDELANQPPLSPIPGPSRPLSPISGPSRNSRPITTSSPRVRKGQRRPRSQVDDTFSDGDQRAGRRPRKYHRQDHRSADGSDEDSRHRMRLRHKRHHDSSTDEEDLLREEDLPTRRGKKKTSRLFALHAAMEQQLTLQVAEARAVLRARQAESRLRQQLAMATSGWVNTNPATVLRTLAVGASTAAPTVPQLHALPPQAPHATTPAVPGPPVPATPLTSPGRPPPRPGQPVPHHTAYQSRHLNSPAGAYELDFPPLRPQRT